MTLVAFLLARLHEDERAAQRANPNGSSRISAINHSVACYSGDILLVSRFTSARVLAEVAAKLAIVEPHRGVHRCEWGDYAGGEAGECTAGVLRYLAVPFADHPDYQLDWAPSTP